MKIATWNVNSLKIRLPHVINWLASNPVDILALQETKLQDVNFPVQAIEEVGYHVIYAGQKSYNGVAIFSRLPAENIVTDIPDLEDPARRILSATIGDVRVINLYVPNGSSVGSEKYSYKLNWLEKMTHYLQQQLISHAKVVVLGDFNIAPADADVHDPKMWEGQTHVSPLEREALQKILQLGFKDTFRLFDQDTASFSWWDYRAGAFRRNHGLRIDLILASEALSKQCSSCIIDKRPRAWEQPSDHAPLLATFTSPA